MKIALQPFGGYVILPYHFISKGGKDMFAAAGKLYLSEKQLTHKQIGEYKGAWNYKPTPIYEDVYGRKVIALYERFPCFDSYDYLHENRYYNWYFIKHGGKIAVVYTEDGRAHVDVCNDLLNEDAKDCCIRQTHYTELRTAGFM